MIKSNLKYIIQSLLEYKQILEIRLVYAVKYTKLKIEIIYLAILKNASFCEDIDKYFKVVSGIVNGEGIKMSDLEADVYYLFQNLKEEEMLLKLNETLQYCKPEKKPIYRIAF
ncbi:unnamed protein product (macronuclear) [Paramecium tetraurelia]|uniref:Uncharacterized protein n=1 Tax=Paramecium tetraurelia TaxID=5888 RepID=A0E9F6_PARTE|nr:uncharacterized protein GSPATT00024654001 [Paramecium tetraurelia]CAK91923.1 unnamed protein product [Paramecium tetraurelia]|eukprot:XP_001459320.1 hypothetical protein (macronuclear) [Paramecium tetraurelia strain d4-2]